jgi:hypothetical protein
MNGAKLILSVGICLGVASALASGCGSSSGGPGPADSSTGPDVNAADGGADSASVSCNPLTMELCPQGQTCCFAGLRGTCTDVSACKAPFHIDCVNSASCGGGGQVCCGSFQLPAGFDASAFADASFDASGFDASDFDASGFVVTLSCASSCPVPDFQACMSDEECPAGMVCGGPPMPGSSTVGLILPCVPADAGFPRFDAAGPDIDAGGPDGDAG